MDFKNLNFSVCGLEGYSFDSAVRHWKTKFETIKHFKRDVITHPSLEPLYSFMEEFWDSIEPITVQEALSVSNTEFRRVAFDCIGVIKLFKSLEPELLDRQVIKKNRTRWDDKNDPYTYEFEDVYELYKIQGEKLFTPRQWETVNPLYAVRCWCTTTGREYWIYVSRDAALGNRWWSEDSEHSIPDAIRAIAWTVRVDVPKESLDKIYRQGDIIVVKLKDSANITGSTETPYHLSKDEYLSLMYSET